MANHNLTSSGEVPPPKAPRLPPLTVADRHAALGVLCHLPGNNSDEMLNMVLDELWAAINARSVSAADLSQP